MKKNRYIIIPDNNKKYLVFKKYSKKYVKEDTTRNKKNKRIFKYNDR